MAQREGWRRQEAGAIPRGRRVTDDFPAMTCSTIVASTMVASTIV
jgi:hypothetical protein